MPIFDKKQIRYRRIIEKEQIYHELSAYFTQQGCPICARIGHETFRFLDGLLYESVNDRGIRWHLRESGGLCATHSQRLYKMGGVLGQSIILNDLIGTMKEKLKHLPQRRSRIPHTLASLFALKKSCPACELEIKVAKQSIDGFLESMKVEAFTERFRRSDGLCLFHFVEAWNQCDSPSVCKEVIRHQQLVMQHLQDQLQEVIRKNDFRFTHEPMNEETGSWLRAARLLSGYFDE